MTDTTVLTTTYPGATRLHPIPPLRIIIPGGEGHLGRLLARRFSNQGHLVTTPAQEWMLAIGAFLLRSETELLLKSRRVVPGVLLNHGFEFQFPQWPEAASDLVRRWRMKGVIGAPHESVRNCQEATIERTS